MYCVNWGTVLAWIPYVTVALERVVEYFVDSSVLEAYRVTRVGEAHGGLRKRMRADQALHRGGALNQKKHHNLNVWCDLIAMRDGKIEDHPKK